MMPTYILLSSLTDEGAKTVKDHPERIKEVNRELEKLNVVVTAQYAVLGPYDFVNIVEAPDNQTIARVSAELASRGSVKIMTLAAMPVDEFIGSLENSGSDEREKPTSTEETKAVARRIYEAFNEAFRTRNLDLLDEFIAADLINHNPAPGQAQGLEGVKQGFSQFLTAFPHAQISVEALIAEGDKVAVRLVGRGAHEGEFLGVPPTGRQVIQTGIDIIRIENGKAVERWSEVDNLGVMQQLGLIPPPSQS
jgi:uncharacterized protein with GYD domain/predicted ester cyclase